MPPIRQHCAKCARSMELKENYNLTIWEHVNKQPPWKVPETTDWKVLSGPVISCQWMADASRGHKFEIRSVEIWAFARQILFMLFPLQVGWKGSLSNSIIQPTILPTNCRIHTERLRPLEFWSVPECKICQFVCRWEGSRHFKTLEFFLHGCII